MVLVSEFLPNDINGDVFCHGFPCYLKSDSLNTIKGGSVITAVGLFGGATVSVDGNPLSHFKIAFVLRYVVIPVALKL